MWRHVRSGQVHTTTAEEYAKIAEQRNPKIHLQLIAKGDIDQIKTQLDAKWEDVLAVPKTHKMHCIIPKGKVMVMVPDTSDSKEYTIVPLRKPDSTDSAEEAVTPLDKSQEPLGRSEEPFVESEEPFVESEEPFVESEEPFVESEEPFVESEEHTIITVDLCV